VRSSPGYDELIGDSKPMLALKAKIERVSLAPGCVLIRGESGAGKELVARAIHRGSHRSDRPMISVNCAAIPHDLMESQLFGHKAGAFTGADRDHSGYFQQADLGTLFLDEVGELTLEGQAKARILEGHPFLPVGAMQEVSVDVRVIAATNQDLQVYVREKKFREDLYYRLSVFELHLPPLRDRADDVGLLVDFFLDHYRRERGRPSLKLSDVARAKLLAYRWPGNVRQLRNVLDSAVVLADGQEIQPHDLGLRDSGGDSLDSLEIDVWEKKLILEALRRVDDNVPEHKLLISSQRCTDRAVRHRALSVERPLQPEELASRTRLRCGGPPVAKQPTTERICATLFYVAALAEIQPSPQPRRHLPRSAAPQRRGPERPCRHPPEGLTPIRPRVSLPGQGHLRRLSGTARVRHVG
jgi:transcriptional regulator with GAF, ATPase, and Fis domain